MKALHENVGKVTPWAGDFDYCLKKPAP